MKLRRVSVAGVLALVAMLLPAFLVSAAPPFRSFTAYGGEECLVWETWRPTGQAGHWAAETLQPIISSSDIRFRGVRHTFGGCDGFPNNMPCKGTMRIVLDAQMLPGQCAATGLELPDYWDGTFTFVGMPPHWRATSVLKGHGRLRGLELRGELDLNADVWTMTGKIIETGGY